MKKLFIFLMLTMSLAISAQTTPSYKNVKLTAVPIGTKNDSIALWNGTDKLLKYLPVSQIKVSTNLDTTASPTGVTVFSSTGNDAVLPLATTINAGLFSPTEKTKLSSIATGATANQTDTYLLNRANHTGAQAISTVTGLQNTLDSKVDKVAGERLIAAAEITKLSNQSGTNTGDQDLSGYATNANLNLKENTANKNAANGYAGLGSDGKLISSQLPSITISDTYVVASQAAMLALNLAETGDVAVRTDLNKSFILKGVNYAVLSDWQELLTPTSSITTVFGRNGAVTAQAGDYTAAQVGAPSGSGTSTGANSGDNAVNTLYSGLVTNASHTGDATGSTVLTLATVNSNVGTFGNASNVAQSTVNAKGLTTAIANVPIQIAESQVTSLVADLLGKEPVFSKLTAFNKNLGTTAATVAEGNDSRILNGQTAFGWGNHAGIYQQLENQRLGTLNDVSFNSVNTPLIALNRSSETGSIDKMLVGFSGNGTQRWSTAPGIQSFLGLGSNAYSSTAYLPLTGGTLTGILNSTASVTSTAHITSGGTSSQFVKGDGSLSSSVPDSRPYKVYTALLSQNGTSVPTATVLENTLGGTVVWTRSTIGEYFGTLSGAFVTNKTTINISSGYNSTLIARYCGVANVNSISISTSYGGSASDGLMGGNYTSVEIRVYN